MSPLKRRALPAWMKQQDSSKTNAPEGKSCDNDLLSCSTVQRGSENCDKSTAGDTLSDDSDNEGLGGIKKRILDCIDTATSKGGSGIEEPFRTSRLNDEGSSKTQDQEDQQSERKTSPLSAERCSDDELITSRDIGGVMGSPGTTSPNVSGQTIRKSCYYGSSCYRKNPQHRLDFAHPGDADFCDAASSSGGTIASSDNRPLCEYGSACYRKNPQHQRDYRHDGPDRRKARPAGMHDIPSDDDGDFNRSISSDDFKPGESESDDSFVTSDSMSSGNSDYDPSDDDKKVQLKKKTTKKKKKEAKGKTKKASE